MPRVAIVGIGQTEHCFRREDVTYPELAREAVTRALQHAALEVRDIEAAVLALAPDALMGVAHAERWVADALGVAGKPFMRVNTGGSTGITTTHAAFYHVASGMFDCVLAAGADRVGESGDAQLVLNTMWDVLYERPFPLNAINMLALQAVRYMAKYGTTEYHMALAAVKNRRHAMRNPHAHLRKEVTVEEVLASRVICWPIKLFDACPQSTGGCALVLCSEEFARRLPGPKAWVAGVGNCVETYFMGDRMGPAAVHDHADADALAEAIARAYRQAGIQDPRREIDVAELYAPFSNIELHAIEAARLCDKGQAGRLLEKGEFHLGARQPVNPSGGVLCTNPIAVTAMVRVAEAALQVMGQAGERQVEGARTALATGIGGDHQFYGAMVLRAG
jgi:acetyl-CoA C-acetyltransferase